MSSYKRVERPSHEQVKKRIICGISHNEIGVTCEPGRNKSCVYPSSKRTGVCSTMESILYALVLLVAFCCAARAILANSILSGTKYLACISALVSAVLYL